MKRILALLLCLVMVFSLAACGGNEKPNDDNTPGTSTESGNKNPTENVGDSDGDIDDKPVETIRPNGELPNNERDLTEAEIHHYVGIIVNAALKLDIDTLREYAKDEKHLEDYQAIANDPVAKEWYLKTIGKSIYIESTGSIAYPEPEAVFQMWQTHFLFTNDVPPAEIKELSLDELTAIYEQYKDKIPYVIDDVNPEYDCEIYLKDGKIYFDLDELLGCTSYCYDIGDLAPSQYSWDGPNAHIAAMIFGHDADEVNNFSEFLAGGVYDYAMPLVEMDLDALVPYMDGLKDEYDWNKTPGEDDYRIKYYQAYIKDDTMRAKVQAWMNENVVCGFSGHGFDVWHKVNQDVYYQTADLTAEEKAILKDLPICGWGYESEYNKAEYVFTLYQEIIYDMIEGDYIEDLV